MKIPHHLTMRVAWHDAKWNGTICRHPSANPYCVALERVRAARLDGGCRENGSRAVRLVVVLVVAETGADREPVPVDGEHPAPRGVGEPSRPPLFL